MYCILTCAGSPPRPDARKLAPEVFASSEDGKNQNHDGEDHNDHDGQDEKAMMMMITTYMLCH